MPAPSYAAIDPWSNATTSRVKTKRNLSEVSWMFGPVVTTYSISTKKRTIKLSIE